MGHSFFKWLNTRLKSPESMNIIYRTLQQVTDPRPDHFMGAGVIPLMPPDIVSPMYQHRSRLYPILSTSSHHMVLSYDPEGRSAVRSQCRGSPLGVCHTLSFNPGDLCRSFASYLDGSVPVTTGSGSTGCRDPSNRCPCSDP